MKKIPRIIISLIILSLVVSETPLLFAADSQFVVTQRVQEGADTIAPTVPTGLTATAVSTSQIDLSWNPSFDLRGVTDYRIYRDNLFIATSGGLTTYSDSGLNPNTTYTYTVSAIDAADNESGRSASSTATTFPVPVTPTQTNSSGPNGSAFVLNYLNVSPDLRGAIIRLGTNVPVKAIVYWGKTRDLELGSLASSLFLADHLIRITDLVPGTQYFFKLELIDGRGGKRTIDNQSFYTLSLPDVTGPDNVRDFRAQENNGSVVLSWKNPEADFDSVRVLRSDIFYPRDPSEGEVIYEGKGESVVDSHVEPGKTYYYTAFAKDPSGNYSSGSVTDIHIVLPGEKPGKPRLFAGIIELSKEKVDALIRALKIWDIDFTQDGVKLPIISNTVEIRGDRSLTISIDYDKLPEILKTIAVTLVDPVDPDKTFSFLLRVNKDKGAYEAHLGAFERPGKYAFTLAILDYKHQGLTRFDGNIIARIPDVYTETKPGFWANPKNLFWLLLILPLIFVMLFFFRIRRKTAITCEPVQNR